MTTTVTTNTSTNNSQSIDLQAEIARREALVRQKNEAEQALREADKNKGAIIKQLRAQAEDTYRALGLTAQEVWSDLAKTGSEPLDASVRAAESKHYVRKKAGEVLPTHKFKCADGETRYFNSTSKGKRPEWIKKMHPELVDDRNKVCTDHMQLFDHQADMQHFIDSEVRAKK